MRFQTLIIALLSVGLLAFGCAQSAGPSQNRPVQVAQQPANAVPNAGDAAAPPLARKIIFNCQIAVVVEDLSAAQQKLTALIESVQKQGGFLANQELAGTNGSRRQGSWTIRVPLGEFDRFVAEIEKLGELERNSRNAQDVTDAFADLEARLRNKQSSEQRLLGHLEKSTQLKDTLELERELSRARGEVEQLQGQLNVMKNKTDLATVTLTMTERQNDIPPVTPARLTFPELVIRTFSESWQNLVTCIQGAILVIVALAPWAVATSLILLPVWLIRRNPRISTGVRATH